MAIEEDKKLILRFQLSLDGNYAFVCDKTFSIQYTFRIKDIKQIPFYDYLLIGEPLYCVGFTVTEYGLFSENISDIITLPNEVF